MFNLIKVFDCQEMPNDIKKLFFESINSSYTNNCYIHWYVKYLEEDNFTLIDQWFIEHGASEGEKIIIKHWW